MAELNEDGGIGRPEWTRTIGLFRVKTTILKHFNDLARTVGTVQA